MKKSTKFMFINKDARSDSLSHSHKHERIQIHSHVQKGRRYKKTDGGIIYASQLPPLQPGHRSTPRNDQDEESNEQDAPPRQTLKKVDGVLRRRASPALPSSAEQYHDRHDLNIDPLLWDYSQHPLRPSESPKWVPVFPGTAEDNFDPFSATCVKIDDAVFSLLQYFLRRYHPNIWHLERVVRSDHMYAFRFNAMTILQGCMHDEYNMYALLAHMSSYMYAIDEVMPSGDWEFYMFKALQASQSYVTSGSPVTGRMIMNTFSLACAEWYRLHSENAIVHLKAAKSLIDSMGGLKALDAPLLELMLTGDAYVAGEQKTKPMWSDADFDNGDGEFLQQMGCLHNELSSLLCQYLSVRSLIALRDSDHPMTAFALTHLQNLLSGTVLIASGLLTSAHQRIIPAVLRWVILDLAVVLSVLRSSHVLEGIPSPKSPEGIHWTHVRSMAIRHRLLHLELEDTRSDVIRTAIVLWMFLCFTVTGRKRSVKVIAPFLKESLLQIPDEEWEGHEEVHLWVLLIGVQCASLGTQEHSWFAARVNQTLDEGIRGSEKIFNTFLGLSERFFYYESAQKFNLRALADDIEDMRGSRGKSRATSLAM